MLPAGEQAPPGCPEPASAPDDPVIAFCRLQRAAQPGEPTCCCCGRYGAYVCAVTDRPVCSSECKARGLVRLGVARVCARPPALLPEPATQAALTARGCGTQAVLPTLCGIGAEPGAGRSFAYVEDAEVNAASDMQIRAIRASLGIDLRWLDATPLRPLVRPVWAFSQIPLAGFTCGTAPTPVQMQSLPLLLSGCDALISAPARSGKTAAYITAALLLASAWMQPVPWRPQLPRVLVLCPDAGRSAAVAVRFRAAAAEAAAQALPAVPVRIARAPEVRGPAWAGAVILIGTPREALLAAASTTEPLFAHVRLLVVDRADCLKLGVAHGTDTALEALETVRQVAAMADDQQIADALSCDRSAPAPPVRQTVVLATCVPPALGSAAVSLMRRYGYRAQLRIRELPPVRPVGHNVGSMARDAELLLWVASASRRKRLFALLADRHHFRPPLLVFVESRERAESLCAAIEARRGAAGQRACVLDSQTNDATLRSFAGGRPPVGVTTDAAVPALRRTVAAAVRTVVSVDMPRTMDAYLWRLRCAALPPCASYAFIDEGDAHLFDAFAARFSARWTLVPAAMKARVQTPRPGSADAGSGGRLPARRPRGRHHGPAIVSLARLIDEETRAVPR